MGHSEEISKNVYQSPLALGEIITVGGFLQSIDRSAHSHVTDGFSIRQISESIIEERREVVLQEKSVSSSTVFPADDETHGVEKEQVSVYSSTEPKSTKGCIMKRNQSQRRYKKWSDKDTKLVKHYFSEYIRSSPQSGVKGSLPGKKIVEEFLQQHQIFQDSNLSPDMLISLVKTKVFNERKKERSYQSFEML